METRTELILLQRTMVVVEGVARSLDPHLNMWEVARPVVEGYIRRSVGPQAVLRDLARTARVLARFGPKLPALAETALIRAGNPATAARPAGRPLRGFWVAAGGAVVFAFGIFVGSCCDQSDGTRSAVMSVAGTSIPPGKTRRVPPAPPRASTTRP